MTMRKLRTGSIDYFIMQRELECMKENDPDQVRGRKTKVRLLVQRPVIESSTKISVSLPSSLTLLCLDSYGEKGEVPPY